MKDDTYSASLQKNGLASPPQEMSANDLQL